MCYLDKRKIKISFWKCRKFGHLIERGFRILSGKGYFIRDFMIVKFPPRDKI